MVGIGHWWSGRRVLVPVRWVGEVSWTANSVNVELRSETIKLAPEYAPSVPLNAEYLARLTAYYSASTSSIGST